MPGRLVSAIRARAERRESRPGGFPSLRDPSPDQTASLATFRKSVFGSYDPARDKKVPERPKCKGTIKRFGPETAASTFLVSGFVRK